MDGGGTVHVGVEPLRVGNTQFTIEIRDAAGNALDVPEVTAAISMAERDLGPFAIALERGGPGLYTAGDVAIPFPGTWRLRITVRTTDIDQTILVTDMTVS
jgi:copper transport protein